MRKTLKLVLFLLLISGIAAWGIAYVNQLTAPLIEEQLNNEKAISFLEVYPGGEEIKDESAKYLDGNTDSALIGVNVAFQDGDPVGVIYLVESSGYNGAIQLMVGFDLATRKISGIKVLSLSETPGLGANAKEKSFTDRFKEKDIDNPLEVVKNEPVGDSQVLAITSATITSKAVTDGVNAARTHFIDHFLK